MISVLLKAPQLLHVAFVPQNPKIIPIKRRQLALQLRIRPGRERTRRHPQLSARTKLPILTVGQIPKLDRRAGIESRTLHGARMEEPLAGDATVVVGQGLRSVDEYVVGVEAEKGVGEEGVVVDEAEVIARDVA